jgi:Secretion system C-terminal sorting domain
LIDLHGHGHDNQRLELGYLLGDADLRLSDSTLGTPQYKSQMSIKNLIINNLNSLNTAQLLRGQFALGTLLAANGFPSVPSQQDVAPLISEFYFNGGYNTLRHGSRDSTTIDGIQIECNFTGVRNTYDNRRRFATQLAATLRVYFGKHYFNSTNFNCRTATDDKANLGIKIYPNPVKNTLNLVFETPISKPLNAHIFTSQGQLIGQFSMEIDNQNQAHLTLPTSLNSGIYFLTLMDEKGENRRQVRFVIE